MRRLNLIILGVVALSGLAVGCGGGEDEAMSKDGATSAPLTKKQFIKQANAICLESAKRLEAEVSAWKKEYPGGPEAAEKNIEEAVQQIAVPGVRRKAEELGSLVPPADDQAKISQILENLQKVSRIYEKEGVESLLGPAAERTGKEMAAYGLNRCTVL